MASEEGEVPPGEEGKGEQGGEHHISFVQRLKAHFTAAVDPRIDLQDEDEQASRKKEADSRTPTTVEDFVKRLSPSVDVGSRYEIKQDVASGGMGTILRVWDGDLRRNLAMKVMHGRGAGSRVKGDGSDAPVDPERLGRFLEEAQITGQLDHPGVVPVHDLGIDATGRCYFTMRFVRGRELKDVFDLAREAKDGWTRTKVLGVILKVCEAMAYAHSKGVVHRDLKPANVMVGRFGETYVMDWGLARVLGRRDSHDLRLKPRAEDASALSLVRTVRRDETELNPESPLVTMDGDVIGTPSYMAPEQARGKLEEVGPRSDVYSLGAILYYMHTGQAPYVRPGERISPHSVLSRVLDGPPTPVEKLAPHEPPELMAICAKAMARDPEQRYGSMLEVADDIQAYLENRVVRAYERGSLAEFKKWVVRNKGMAAGIAGMVTLALASGVFFVLQQRQENVTLRKKEAETARAKNEAVQNLTRAQESEQRARDSLLLAEERRSEADHQAEVARTNEGRALRSSYAANILAADYSLKLNDVAEARAQLRATDASLRGWEWQHLALEANAPLAEVGNFTGVEGLAFQPLENRAIVLTTQGSVLLKDLDTLEDVGPADIALAPELLSTVRKFFSSLAMDANPDGSRLAIAGESGGLQVFDLESGAHPPGVESTGLAGHGATTSAVAYSPNGRYLASGDDDGVIVVRDALNWDILHNLSGHVTQVTGLAWSPGSERMASSSRDGSVRLWDCERGAGIGILRGHRGAVRAVAWDLSGKQLFSCGEDGAVNLWDVEDGRLVRSFLGHTGPVHALDYDPNLERLVTGGSDRTVRVWDVHSGTCRILRGHESAVREVAFDASGERVLSGDQNGKVYLWDSEGDLAATELRLHRDAVSDLAFDPSGKRLVSASEDHELIVWEAATGEPLRRLRGHTGMVNSVVFSSDGRSILSGSQDKSAILWDAETGSRLRMYGPFDKWIEAAALTPDGTRVVVATGEKKVRILDAVTTEVLHELPGYKYPAEALALSPDGALLASVGREFKVWDLRGSLEKPLSDKDTRNTSVVFSPDGKRIATCTTSGLLQLWDAHTGEWLIEQQDKLQRMHALVYTPDSKRLITASEDGLVHVRDAASGVSLLTLREPRGAVLVLACSPDGARLATGTRDGTVRIYETTPARARREQRRAAAGLREQASALIDELFAEHLLLADVLRQLHERTDLPQTLREAALRQAHLRGDDPLPLLMRSIAECLDSEQPEKTYEHALARATAAKEMRSGVTGMPEWELDGLNDLAVAAAYIRVKEFQKARNLLEKEVKRPNQRPESRGLFGPREQALRLLFLCMAQCQTPGQQHEAERSWRQAQQGVLNDMELSQQDELLDLLAEVETLVRSSAPAGS